MDDIPSWTNSYVGIPYVTLGRDKSGWDCWGCVAIVHKEQFGSDIGSYEGIGCAGPEACSAGQSATVVAQYIEEQRGLLWDDVAFGQEVGGDLLLLKALGATIHVGIVCTPGVMLHCSPGTDTCLERYTLGRWSRRIDRIIRYRKCHNVSEAI